MPSNNSHTQCAVNIIKPFVDGINLRTLGYLVEKSAIACTFW